MEDWGEKQIFTPATGKIEGGEDNGKGRGISAKPHKRRGTGGGQGKKKKKCTKGLPGTKAEEKRSAVRHPGMKNGRKRRKKGDLTKEKKKNPLRCRCSEVGAGGKKDWGQRKGKGGGRTNGSILMKGQN